MTIVKKLIKAIVIGYAFILAMMFGLIILTNVMLFAVR